MGKHFDIAKLVPINFILVGVGGQGTILASDILAEAGIKLGYDVKKAEVHGMSQRGGSVVSNLRWAPQVFSPIVSLGSADVLIAFEKLEAARFRGYLHKGGVALINQYSIPPVTVSGGASHYPSDEQITDSLIAVGASVFWVEGIRLAEDVGNLKTANVVILGALIALLGFPANVVVEIVRARVPAKFQEMNLLAFEAGYHSLTVAQNF